jgi:hypothetical protein
MTRAIEQGWREEIDDIVRSRLADGFGKEPESRLANPEE